MKTFNFAAVIVCIGWSVVSCLDIQIDNAGGDMVKQTGQTVELMCNILYIDASTADIAGNPVTWEKLSRRDNPLYTIISTGSNKRGGVPDHISIDFGDYSTSVPNTSGIKNSLKISGLEAGDNGTYACLAGDVKIEYNLIIPSPVEAVVLDDSKTNVTTQLQTFEYTEGETRPLNCTSHGGSPDAKLKVTFDGVDKTSEMVSYQKWYLENPESAFEAAKVAVSRAVNYEAKGEDNLKIIRCTASVDGLPNSNKFAEAKMHIQFSPMFVNCSEKVAANIGDENVIYECETRCDPAPTKVFFITQTNAEMIAEIDHENTEENFAATYIKNEGDSYTIRFTFLELTDADLGYLFQACVRNTRGAKCMEFTPTKPDTGSSSSGNSNSVGETSDRNAASSMYPMYAILYTFVLLVATSL
ncbi:unnamed protein product [Owenia fusiformis]|uniref:Uncharacterized protein n=1 Tax=Owenia fusiformis TaxID=6347 RepID=A0A8J1UGL8_OWEFU|nr:unnamed protein product [Owenia fusiformis]